MTYREVTRKLRALGCQELRRRTGGSHRKWLNPRTQRVSTLPDWGHKDLKQGQFERPLSNSALTGLTSRPRDGLSEGRSTFAKGHYRVFSTM